MSVEPILTPSASVAAREPVPGSARMTPGERRGAVPDYGELPRRSEREVQHREPVSNSEGDLLHGAGVLHQSALRCVRVASFTGEVCEPHQDPGGHRTS